MQVLAIQMNTPIGWLDGELRTENANENDLNKKEDWRLNEMDAMRSWDYEGNWLCTDRNSRKEEKKGKEGERQLTRGLSAAREINCKIWNDLLGEEKAIDNIGRIDGWGTQTLIHEYCGQAN